MQWQLNGSNYEVLFDFGTQDIKLPTHKGVRTVTRSFVDCVLSQVDKNQRRIPLAKVRSTCDSRDRFDLQKGCQWAFTKALVFGKFNRKERFETWREWFLIFNPSLLPQMKMNEKVQVPIPSGLTQTGLQHEEDRKTDQATGAVDSGMFVSQK